ncbi:MAG TPA: ABC transporter permease, partial [Patescibacteria group bacterium]|nr:ABC transporter permease [Patescibacteria group bacterium]
RRSLLASPSWKRSRFSPGLFLNYLKVSCRKLVRQKGYSLINIAGLAVGMAACLLILLFVRDELSYDRYHHEANRIFRVAAYIRFGGMEGDIGSVPAPLAESCRQEFPEVEQTARFRKQGNFIVRHGERSYTESRLIFADASIFQVFTLPTRSGNPLTALAEPRTIVLSESTARKYFGAVDPVGQTLRLDNREDYRITGVYRDIPANSHFHFDLIASLASLEESRQPRWDGNNFFTYLLLRPGSDPAALQAKFPNFIRKYLGPWVKQAIGSSIDELFASGARVEYYLQPLPDIHLHSQLRTEIEVNGDIRIVYIFSAIALLILVIAAINFINLATARSAGRSKEAGIRKVLGSERRQLVRQFLADSLLLSGLAVLLALLLTAIALPWFNNLTAKKIDWSGAGIGFVAASAALMTLLVGVLAGLYPAWRLASARPADVLKGNLAAGVRGGRLRAVLVVFQFAVSMVLIIGTLVVTRQIHFIQNKNLGFDKDQVLVLQNAYLLENQAVSFKNEMRRHPAIVSATVSGFLPVPPASRNDTSIFPKGKSITSSNMVLAQNWTVDADYIKTMGMKIVAGRDFAKDAPADKEVVIINQAMARRFGWQEPLGRQISFPPPDNNLKTFTDRTVIGVLEDFHFESLRSPIGPLAMFLGGNRDRISFRFQAQRTTAVLAELKRLWQRFAPGQPFEYTFIDERFAELYRSEQQLGTIFSVFSGLAIFVACLGLLALASFMAERRTKEIGVRKILGATVAEITILLSREFVKWVVIAALIAWPLAYFTMRRWLQGFAYRTDIGIGLFMLSSLLALLIAILAVSFQAIRAARANPVDSLRYE